MLKIAIVVGSTRPGRKAAAVAEWVHGLAKQRGDAEYEILDIEKFELPLLDEPVPPSMGQYSKEHTKKWSAAVASYDGYVFVTPEYNHGIPGALKNALDFVYREWNNKAAAFVSYGSGLGIRSVEHLRGVMAELQIADVRAVVQMSLYTDFEKFTTFKPAPAHEKSAATMFDQLEAWAGALKPLRAAK